MSFIKDMRERLEEKKQSMADQMQRGREVTEQMRAEKLRKQQKKILEGKPSAVNTMRKHMMMRTKNPLDVMKDEYNRRKHERNKSED